MTLNSAIERSFCTQRVVRVCGPVPPEIKPKRLHKRPGRLYKRVQVTSHYSIHRLCCREKNKQSRARVKLRARDPTNEEKEKPPGFHRTHRGALRAFPSETTSQQDSEALWRASHHLSGSCEQTPAPGQDMVRSPSQAGAGGQASRAAPGNGANPGQAC